MTTKDTNVVFVIADMRGGGAQQVASQIMNALTEKEHKVSLITLSTASTDMFALNNSIGRISLGFETESKNSFQKIKNNILRVYLMRKALKNLNYSTAISFIAPTNILLIFASIGLKYRIIISERNDPERQSFGKSWDLLRRMLYNRADLITANSLGALTSLKKFVSPKKLLYLPNPLRQNNRKDIQPNTKRKPIFLNVARLHYQKGQDLLLRAFAKVTEHLPDWELHIAGQGQEQDALHRLSKDLKIKKKVTFLGHVEDPFEQYQKASVFVLPSRYEGMPNALLEAMSTGLPVIVSNRIPDHAKLFNGAQPGLSIDPENIEALASAMLKLGKSEAIRSTFSETAKSKVKPFQANHVLPIWEKNIWPE